MLRRLRRYFSCFSEAGRGSASRRPMSAEAVPFVPPVSPASEAAPTCPAASASVRPRLAQSSARKDLQPRAVRPRS